MVNVEDIMIVENLAEVVMMKIKPYICDKITIESLKTLFREIHG